VTATNHLLHWQKKMAHWATYPSTDSSSLRPTCSLTHRPPFLLRQCILFRSATGNKTEDLPLESDTPRHIYPSSKRCNERVPGDDNATAMLYLEAGLRKVWDGHGREGAKGHGSGVVMWSRVFG